MLWFRNATLWQFGCASQVAFEQLHPLRKGMTARKRSFNVFPGFLNPLAETHSTKTSEPTTANRFLSDVSSKYYLLMIS